MSEQKLREVLEREKAILEEAGLRREATTLAMLMEQARSKEELEAAHRKAVA